MTWKPEPFDSLLREGALPPTKNWIVEGFLPDEFTVGLIAEESSGKSLVALDLALAVASGQDFLGMRVTQPGRVLYFDEENPTEVIRERLYGLCQGRRLDVRIQDQLHFFRFRFSECSGPPTWTPLLHEAVKEYGARLVVIDTYSCLFGPSPLPGAENDNTYAKAMLSRIRRSCLTEAQEPRAVVILHHTSKDPFTRGKPRGASGFANHVDNYYNLAKDGPEDESGYYPTVLKPGKKRLLEGIVPIGVQLMKGPGGIYRLVGREPVQRKGK